MVVVVVVVVAAVVVVDSIPSHTRPAVTLPSSSSSYYYYLIYQYRAGATKDGKLVAMDANVYSNAGFSMDLSIPVTDRALFHIDNCYKWPSLRAKYVVVVVVVV